VATEVKGDYMTDSEKVLSNPERFRKLWNEAGAVKDVAVKMEITQGSARTLAWMLRSLGYDLKKHTAGRKKNEK
jgi:hypothetical protein